MVSFVTQNDHVSSHRDHHKKVESPTVERAVTFRELKPAHGMPMRLDCFASAQHVG
ncbi:MAG: hypothetical protein JWM11_5788 [Planctomycetaceae bacterium]|nr:hypothetical protein [Planctomycetaceae bacterium]